jgi:hypothetical protein
MRSSQYRLSSNGPSSNDTLTHSPMTPVNAEGVAVPCTATTASNMQLRVDTASSKDIATRPITGRWFGMPSRAIIPGRIMLTYFQGTTALPSNWAIQDQAKPIARPIPSHCFSLSSIRTVFTTLGFASATARIPATPCSLQMQACSQRVSSNQKWPSVSQRSSNSRCTIFSQSPQPSIGCSAFEDSPTVLRHIKSRCVYYSLIKHLLTNMSTLRIRIKRS